LPFALPVTLPLAADAGITKRDDVGALRAHGSLRAGDYWRLPLFGPRQRIRWTRLCLRGRGGLTTFLYFTGYQHERGPQATLLRATLESGYAGGGT